MPHNFTSIKEILAAYQLTWIQALLQTVICQKLNQSPEIPIFAIVTTGDG